MNKIILIILGISLLLFSGCGNTYFFTGVDINDTNSSLTTTYSSSKINNLTNITGYTGNQSVMVSLILNKTLQYKNGILLNIS